jgi:hypothetical protein
MTRFVSISALPVVPAMFLGAQSAGAATAYADGVTVFTAPAGSATTIALQFHGGAFCREPVTFALSDGTTPREDRCGNMRGSSVAYTHPVLAAGTYTVKATVAGQSKWATFTVN